MRAVSPADDSSHALGNFVTGDAFNFAVFDLSYTTANLRFPTVLHIGIR